MNKKNILNTVLVFTFLSACTMDKADPLDNFNDWAIYKGDKKGLQWSELDQINTKNVKMLKVAWIYKHGKPGGPSMYSNPIMIDGLIYFTSPTLDAICVDARTGEEVWRFVSADYNENGEIWTGRNRGVVYWKGEEGERIFLFVRNRVYAMDAKTGKHITPFGTNGKYIDLNYDLGKDPTKTSVEMTSPGIVYKNHLIMAGRVTEGYSSSPGDIRGYSAVTGEFEWIFHTVPHEGEEGFDTWEFQADETYGGANPWGGFTLDEERGWVFCATGSPAPDFIYGGTRKGDNLFGNCILALNAETGEKIWHYQNIHHDIFDYDNPPAPVLATTTDKGIKRDIVVQFTKMGLTYVLDRETGKPIFDTPEVAVPQTIINEEESSPTQPIPVRPPPLVRTHMTEDDITDISQEAHDYVLDIFKKYDTGPLYTPSNEKGVITTPGHQGGAEWGGGAFNPNTNIIYVNVNEAPTINRLVPFYDSNSDDAPTELKGALIYKKNCTACHGVDRQGMPPAFSNLKDLKISDDEIRTILKQGRGNMSAFTQLSKSKVNDLIAFLKSTGEEYEDISNIGQVKYSSDAPFLVDHEGYPGIKPPWGTLNAINLVTGQLEWKVPLGEYPELVKRGIIGTGSKNFGGPIATAGGVVFIAATADEKIRSFDQATGEQLWEYKLPAAAYATPSTFMLDGKQYLVILCGGGGKNKSPYGDALVAFTLTK
tara:strand:+ start:3034 stop:5160 length:2127 start_codon:yes stop_codon:yes gene_type:complete